MRTALILILPACLLALGATTQESTVQPAKVADGVHSIALPPLAAPQMPDGPGQEVYAANCILCHTQRYVTMQPNFSRKVWTAEVEKMKKVYGAPIQDEQMPRIVDYLVSVRGAEPAATKP